MASTDATFENLLLNWQKGITKLTIKASETITLNGKQFVDKESFDAACKYADEIGKKPKITPEELGPVNLTFKEVLRQVEVCAQVLSEMSGQADSSADEIAKLKEMVACRDGEIANLKKLVEDLQEELCHTPPKKTAPDAWPLDWGKWNKDIVDAQRKAQERERNNRYRVSPFDKPYTYFSTGNKALDEFAEIFGLKPMKRQESEGDKFLKETKAQIRAQMEADAKPHWTIADTYNEPG
jgi:hypothetical protein